MIPFESYGNPKYRYHKAIDCPAYEWETCDEPLVEFEITCDPLKEEWDELKISKTIELEDDIELMKNFNQFSDVELEVYFGKMKPSASLNEYMSKIYLCQLQETEIVENG